ncbi:MAG: hypothetical protein V4736_05705 [Bdellovibrionota bacterium]
MFWNQNNLFPALAPDTDRVPGAPGFTYVDEVEATENAEDEAEILGDQDVTLRADNLSDDENMGAPSNSLEAMENEPADFMRGELDVKEQMDRAAVYMDASIHGHAGVDDEDDPTTELGSAFKNTPGGIEEVAQKTDEELARRNHAQPSASSASDKKGGSIHHGHSTGAFTDVGAGRSGVTRTHEDLKHRH